MAQSQYPEYKIMVAGSLGELVALVNLKLLDGWNPQGGVSVCTDPSGGLVWTQAVSAHCK